MAPNTEGKSATDGSFNASYNAPKIPLKQSMAFLWFDQEFDCLYSPCHLLYYYTERSTQVESMATVKKSLTTTIYCMYEEQTSAHTLGSSCRSRRFPGCAGKAKGNREPSDVRSMRGFRASGKRKMAPWPGKWSVSSKRLTHEAMRWLHCSPSKRPPSTRSVRV